MADQPMHVLFVGSSGGHLTQLRALKGWWQHHERTWVTFDKPDVKSVLAGEEVIWGHHPTTRNVWNLLRNTVLAWRVLGRVQPDVVISTGAGLALPFFLLAKMRGITTCYIEVYDRIESASLTGRLCRPLSSVFMLQWDEQRRMYPDGVVIGRLL